MCSVAARRLNDDASVNRSRCTEHSIHGILPLDSSVLGTNRKAIANVGVRRMTAEGNQPDLRTQTFAESGTQNLGSVHSQSNTMADRAAASDETNYLPKYKEEAAELGNAEASAVAVSGDTVQGEEVEPSASGRGTDMNEKREEAVGKGDDVLSRQLVESQAEILVLKRRVQEYEGTGGVGDRLASHVLTDALDKRRRQISQLVLEREDASAGLKTANAEIALLHQQVCLCTHMSPGRKFAYENGSKS